MACLKGPHGEVGVGCRQREVGPGAVPLLGPVGGVLQGSWAKAQ